MHRGSLLAVFFAPIFAVACASPPAIPAESPDAVAATPQPSSSAVVEEKTAAPEASKPSENSAPRRSDALPDDYSLTPSDCDALGRQYGVAARADQMAALSPKLSAKQRAGVEENVDRVVSKLEQSWNDACQRDLAGKSVDRSALKCAVAAKTVKAFDVCLNGEDPAATKVRAPSGKAKGQ